MIISSACSASLITFLPNMLEGGGNLRSRGKAVVSLFVTQRRKFLASIAGRNITSSLGSIFPDGRDSVRI